MSLKLADYCRRMGISYRTGFRWFHAGKIKGLQMDTGTILITEPVFDSEPVPAPAPATPGCIATYARVSATENQDNLERQSQRLLDYCAAKGYQVRQVVKEIGSGVNDTRPKLMRLLSDPAITVIVVEHKDRLTRFGFNYIDCLLQQQGRRIEVINLAENGKEDLVQDFVSIITSFSRAHLRAAASTAQDRTANCGVKVRWRRTRSERPSLTSDPSASAGRRCRSKRPSPI